MAPASGVDAPFTPNLSVVVGRGLGTVTVTVDGELNAAGTDFLEGVLTDLIEGQGNLAVAVDLGKAIIGPEALKVFIATGRQARRHGTRFILKDPPTETTEALDAGGVGDLIEIQRRRPFGGEA